jgi:D-glycero-D-manno-heptose 1,7-bisphosphate phosphatase
VLVDRDGTLNRDRGFLWRWSDFEWIEGVPEALASLRAAGFVLAAVTNQSGVARGRYTEADVAALHARIDLDLAGRIGSGLDGWYFCPHLPDAGCRCRKPSPGMLEAAARDLGLDLAASFMVGDKTLDVLAGLNAGVGRSILVRTGYGAADAAAVPAGVEVVDDFPAAAARVIALAAGG